LTNQKALRRIRLLARCTLVLGVAASIAANVLHARSNPISQGIAAWPPLALLLSVELVARVPVHRRSLAVVRIAATAAIAGIAAWVSYWHMTGVCARYGESPVSAHLMPLCVDGLVVVASISLVELAGRLRALDTATDTAATQPAPRPVPRPAVAGKATGPRAATRAPAKKSAQPAKTTSPRKAGKAHATSTPVVAAPRLPDATGTTPQAAAVTSDAAGPAGGAAQQVASVAG
jgi:hypothetical protein